MVPAFVCAFTNVQLHVQTGFVRPDYFSFLVLFAHVCVCVSVQACGPACVCRMKAMHAVLWWGELFVSISGLTILFS